MKVTSMDLFGSTPLHYAAGYASQNSGHIACAEILLKNGANRDATDNWSRTPLWCASSGGDISITQFLVRCGSSVDIKGNSVWDPTFYTPKEIAKKHRDSNLVEFLEWTDILRSVESRDAKLISQMTQEGSVLLYQLSHFVTGHHLYSKAIELALFLKDCELLGDLSEFLKSDVSLQEIQMDVKKAISKVDIIESHKAAFVTCVEKLMGSSLLL